MVRLAALPRGRVDALVAVVPVDAIPRRGVARNTSSTTPARGRRLVDSARLGRACRLGRPCSVPIVRGFWERVAAVGLDDLAGLRELGQ